MIFGAKKLQLTKAKEVYKRTITVTLEDSSKPGYQTKFTVSESPYKYEQEYLDIKMDLSSKFTAAVNKILGRNRDE